MNKKNFSSKTNEESILLSNIYEKISLAYKTYSVVYSNEFYTPNIWKKLIDLCNDEGINLFTYGVFEDSERRMVAFSVDYCEELHYPLELLKISTNSKFIKLTHRDFLGAVMGLGIKREKFSDLILKDGTCYLAVSKDVSEFLKCNLDYINKSPCKVEATYILEEDIPKYDLEDKVIFVTSNRLDNYIASICNISRNRSVELISDGGVLVDYNYISEKNFQVEENSTITIRGYGKYKISNVLGHTQKDRMKVLVKKYI